MSFVMGFLLGMAVAVICECALYIDDWMTRRNSDE